MQEITLKWAIWQTPLESCPDPEGTKLLDLPRYAIVRPTGNSQLAGDSRYPWLEVEYINVNMQKQIGWIYDGYLEDYFPNTGDVVHIDPSAKSTYPYGPVQDINFNSEAQSNLSAEFCAAYVGGDAIVGFLKKCQGNPDLSFAFKSKSSGIVQVQQLFTGVYGYSSSDIKSLADGLTDPVMGSQITSSRVSKKLATHHLVALVHIDSTGEIVFFDALKDRTPDMLLHWIVVDQVAPFGFNDGVVTLYNPYSNNMEKIAYRLLCQSMSPGQSGLWIPGKNNAPAPSDISTL